MSPRYNIFLSKKRELRKKAAGKKVLVDVVVHDECCEALAVGGVVRGHKVHVPHKVDEGRRRLQNRLQSEPAEELAILFQRTAQCCNSFRACFAAGGIGGFAAFFGNGKIG